MLSDINIKSKKIYLFIVGFLIYLTYSYNNYMIFKKHELSRFMSYSKNITQQKEREQQIYIYKGTEDFLINTTRCYIPNYTKKLIYQKIHDAQKTCGDRAVFIQRKGNKITFKIDAKIMKKYIKNNKYDCCYSFVSRSTISGKEDTQVNYTTCTSFSNNTTITLKKEVTFVTCYDNRKKGKNKGIVYKDAYIMLIRKTKKNKKKSQKKQWNVLMLGMDTMSRARVMSTMPHTVQYLQKHDWLDYKGYQKVGPNTFPNLVAVLTGKTLNAMTKSCVSGLDNCNDYIIWSKFRRAGYMTAFGEDNLSLPDTFGRYNGFKTQPTDHYMRPLFITGEQRVGNVICTKHMPSAKHILTYAYDFANAYKKENFFGFFWINSYSHNPEQNPKKFDEEIVNFLEQLNNTGVTENTLIIFFSDHGIRFGDMRLPMESYYEERLPMLFIWTPPEFRKLHYIEYYNLQLNQHRLVTPYDLHATLVEIINARNSKQDHDYKSVACPKCTSLFVEKSVNRSCADAGVHNKWCTCHGMTRTNVNKSLIRLAVTYIQKKSKTVKTKKCWKCSPLIYKRILRAHFYKEASNKLYYVVAFEMSPGDLRFEAIILRELNNYTILEPMEAISQYNNHGNCVETKNMTSYCMCIKTKC